MSFMTARATSLSRSPCIKETINSPWGASPGGMQATPGLQILCSMRLRPPGVSVVRLVSGAAGGVQRRARGFRAAGLRGCPGHWYGPGLPGIPLVNAP